MMHGPTNVISASLIGKITKEILTDTQTLAHLCNKQGGIKINH